MKVKIEKDIKTLRDLISPLSVEQAREILKKMGAKFEPIPEVDLGNLSLQKIHMRMYVCSFNAVRKTKDGGFVATMIGDFDPDWKIDENLIVKNMTIEESLRRYAQMIKEEYEDLSDKQLMEYGCLGRKRYGRALDERLRRGLIDEVNENFVFLPL